MASMTRTMQRAMRRDEVSSSRKSDRNAYKSMRIKEWEKEHEQAEEFAQKRKEDPTLDEPKPTPIQRFMRWLQRMGKRGPALSRS